MERFIVHIYRREGEGGSTVYAGLIEPVPEGRARPFRSRDDFWEIVDGDEAGDGGGGGNDNGSPNR